jgi:hypothetical protein
MKRRWPPIPQRLDIGIGFRRCPALRASASCEGWGLDDAPAAITAKCCHLISFGQSILVVPCSDHPRRCVFLSCSGPSLSLYE